MPRGKSAARRGNHQTSSRGGRRGPNNQSSFEPSEGSTHRRGNHGFTLEEEARNTERHHDFWNTDRKLRHAKVNFVSAGTLEPLEPKDTETAMAKMTLESPEPGDNETMTVLEEDHEEQLTINKPFVAEMLLDCETPVPKGIETISRIENNNVEQATFIIDPRGSSTRIQTGLPPPIIRSSSPTPSNSSEEVILFRGRDREGRAISRASSDQRVTRPKESIDRKIRVVEDRIHELQQVLHQPTISRPAVPAETSSEDDSRFLGKPKSRRIRQKELEKQSLKKAEEDAILADYLANISEEDVTPLETFGQRELGGDIDSWQKTGESSSDALKVNKILGQQERGGSLDPWQETGESSSDALKVNEILNSEWTHSDICDFDDLSTSDGLRGEVHAILSKRNRPSGIQYLIVWQNHDVDEARWVPSSTLRSEIALAQIAEFEREETFVPQYADNEDEDTSGSADINLGGDIIEVEEDVDDENVNKQQIKHMSDEQLARLLAKQEELGMGSAELLLFDNEADADEDEYESYSRSKFTPMMMPSKGKGKEPGSKRPRGDFPSAARLADAYDGFDVMDFDRPSLKKKPKGRKGKLVFDLSDSELEAAMQMSWENDRTKKKDKKLEREELRSQGLLGGKTGKTDMSSKYKDGMGIHAVKEEIKNFLMGDNTTLALPPMEKADRKVVHELANAFNLKSKSAGGGNKRFPILYRTQRTHIFTENAFNAVEARLSRKFLPRMDAKRSGVAVKRAGTGGSFNKAAVSYRDGDIVGGSAPELGAENKGRAMLEKMGWSSGTALGALNNKGILQPVSHVVKTTKAGLG